MIGVFGANGFIGKHVTRSLAAQGAEVTAVARSFDDELLDLGVRRVRGDLRDRVAMAGALEGVDTVIQLMGSSTPAQGNASATEDIENNVIPHVEFLAQCVASGVRRVVFMSSGGTVYGQVAHERRVPETTPTHPLCSHGVTKLMVEQFIRLHSHLDGLEHVILRAANLYGPGQRFRNGQGLIPALMERQARGLPVTIFGDGSASRDYVFIDDLVDAVHAAVRLDGAPREVLNIGTGKRTTILDVVRTIEEVTGTRFELEHVPARCSDVHSIALDASAARRTLGWAPQVEFRDGVARTLVPALTH